jgi:hypothetical protein
MEQILAEETRALIEAVVQAAGAHVDSQNQESFEFGFDLSSECVGQGKVIAVQVERSFPRPDLRATVEVEVYESTLSITVTCLSPYVSFQRDGAWFVDIPEQGCWRFETSDEGSAVELACYLNSAPHARNVRSLLPQSGLDVDSLDLWMLDLKSQGILVKAFEHKKI